MTKPITIVTKPTIVCIAKMSLDEDGLKAMIEWLKEYRPACLPCANPTPNDLFPHDGTEILDEPSPVQLTEPDGTVIHGTAPWRRRDLTDNEKLVELCGRTCYTSFGAKAGKKTNREYIGNMMQGDVPHMSVLYHATMSFFIAGISRRMSHELIRNYVGADRDERGNPSQESTRYTHHPGHMVGAPRHLEDEHFVSDLQVRGDTYVSTKETSEAARARFKNRMQDAYDNYLRYIEEEIASQPDAKDPGGLARKRIYEAAAGFLPGQAATSFVWTTNPGALAKLFRERAHLGADLEFYRLATMWKTFCLNKWPNLFQFPWLREKASAT